MIVEKIEIQVKNSKLQILFQNNMKTRDFSRPVRQSRATTVGFIDIEILKFL